MCMCMCQAVPFCRTGMDLKVVACCGVCCGGVDCAAQLQGFTGSVTWCASGLVLLVVVVVVSGGQDCQEPSTKRGKSVLLMVGLVMSMMSCIWEAGGVAQQAH